MASGINNTSSATGATKGLVQTPKSSAIYSWPTNVSKEPTNLGALMQTSKTAPASYASSTTATSTPGSSQSIAPQVKPAVVPVAQKPVSDGSLGAYKGVPITPGDQADIQAQMAKIDGQQSQAVSPATSTSPSPASQPGLVPTPQGSTGVGTGGGQAPQGMEYNGQGQLVPKTTFTGLVDSLASTADRSSPEYQAAQSQYNDANQKLADLKNASANNQFVGAGTNIAEYAGTQGLLANRLANQEQALTGEMSAAQAAAQVATGQQGTQQSGLAAAGTLAQPQVGQYGQTYYNPLSGGTSSGSVGVSPSDPFYGTLQTYAQALANNQGGTIPASVTGNPVLNAQVLQMAKAINPNFNYNTAQGIAQGEQQVGSTSGAIQSQQQQQVAQYKSALQQGQNLQSQLTNLITTFGLNPSDVNRVNSTLQAIASNTSSAQYKQLSNYVNDVANTYAQILTPPGGSATDTTRSIAASMLDATASGTSLIQVMQGLDNQAEAKIAGTPTEQNTGTYNNSSSGTSSGGGQWDF